MHNISTWPLEPAYRKLWGETGGGGMLLQEKCPLEKSLPAFTAGLPEYIKISTPIQRANAKLDDQLKAKHYS